MEVGFSNGSSTVNSIKQSGFFYIKNYLIDRKEKVFLLILLIIIGILVSSITPFLFGNIIDNITILNMCDLRKNIILFLFFGIITQLISIIESIVGNGISLSIGNEIKVKLIKKILLMKATEQDSYSTGEFINRLEGDADAVVEYYIDLLSSFIMITINIIISIIYLLSISKILTIIAVFMLPFSYLINFLFGNRIKILKYIEKKTEDENCVFINCVLSNLKNTKVLQIEKEFIYKYKDIKNRQYEIAKKNVLVTYIVEGLQQHNNLLFEIIIVYISAMMIAKGNLTIGCMVAFNLYLEKFWNVIGKLQSMNLNRQAIAVNINRLIELEFKEMEDISFIKENIDIKELQFKNVCFGYSDKIIIDGVSFTINESGLYSFVGENGAGKTTILKIINKLYESDKGKIFINKSDINDISTEIIRNSISYMMKETLIISDSLINNLLLGVNREVEEEEIIRLCNQLKLEKLIRRVGGYSGYISADILSSGEKQRIGLIRAILKKSKLLLLDEVSSDLDGNMEGIIISLLLEISKQTIIINVSHRKNLIIASKKIFVMKNGQIVEQGTYNELKNIKGYYSTLFENEYYLKG